MGKKHEVLIRKRKPSLFTRIRFFIKGYVKAISENYEEQSEQKYLQRYGKEYHNFYF